jgi:two-component system, NarL family, nitrate/nitrite response regulator NarL
VWLKRLEKRLWFSIRCPDVSAQLVLFRAQAGGPLLQERGSRPEASFLYNTHVTVLSPIRVMVVGRDGLTRAGLIALISRSSEFVMCGQSEGGDELPADVELYRPDIVVWDVSDSTQRGGFAPDLAVPIVAIVRDDEGAAAAWREGAAGVLPRDVRPAALAAAIRAAYEGLGVLDRRFSAALPLPQSLPGQHSAEALSGREIEVLQLVAEGLPNKSIAERLGISEHTVKFHLNSILGKMGAQSRTQAVTQAMRLGLISL